MTAASAKKVAFVHIAVDTLGYLLGLVVTPASEQDRAQLQELAKASAIDDWRNSGNCLCRSRLHWRANRL